MYKWIIGGGLYFMTHKLGFAVLGFIIGGFIDYLGRSNKSGNNKNVSDAFSYYQQRSSRYNFPTMLMALSAVVMKADGSVKRVELDYVKNFFNHQFGNKFTHEHLQVLKHFLDSGQIPINEICQDIKSRLHLEGRIQLVHYLFAIAKSDGEVGDAETASIQQLSGLMGIPAMEFESVKNMFYRSADSDYKILGVTAAASDDEIKKAYRKMAITFHPDKVAQMGEEYQKGAKEKFQQIQDSYDNIKKKRGFK